MRKALGREREREEIRNRETQKVTEDIVNINYTSGMSNMCVFPLD
jgi:hypothetical protein